MRVLMSHTGETAGPGEVDDELLARLYAAEPTDDGAWLRVNMVTTVDGSAQGENGVSDGINNAADKRVYDALRSYADVILVGARTARIEHYGTADVPVVLVSRAGELPASLRGQESGRVILVTVEQAEGLAAARAELGEENVWVLGGYTVDFSRLRRALVDHGFRQVLSEGGPHLLRELLAVGAVDELCVSVVPRLVAGDHLRITAGPPVDVPLEPLLLLEEGGTLISRWRVGG